MSADEEFSEPGQETQPSPVQSRTQAFGEGHQGYGSPALQQSEEKDNAEAPHSFGGVVPAFHPSGLNMQVMPSGDGSSEQDKSRILLGGGYLPTSNGSSESSYQNRRPFLSPTIGGVS
jgi:hypothetical protein